MYLTDEQPELVRDPRCTCHSIREGAGGVTFSLAMLGVLCGHCESPIADAEAESRMGSHDPRRARSPDVALGCLPSAVSSPRCAGA